MEYLLTHIELPKIYSQDKLLFQTVYFNIIIIMKAQGLGVLGEGKGAVFALTKISKGNLARHIRRPIQQHNI